MEKEKIKYSIIVPVYNAQRYIERCINSVFLQTETNWELILIDDGSKDGSGEICQRFAALDTRVKYLYQENKGVSAARNKGLDIACGEWITFMDSDDWVEPFHLATFSISYFNPTNGNGISVNFEHMTVGLGLYLFFAAMIAITAMVLPGISGSTLLLIFGLYVPVINAIHEFMHLNLSYFPVLVIFGLGVLTGIVSIIKIIKICLAKHRSQTIYMILGLMIGSLYAITQGPTTLDVPQQPMSFSTFHIGFFILGAVILAGLELLKTRLEKQDGGRK